jgi:hypothetical protein
MDREDIFDMQFFSKLNSNIVWSNAPFHEESKYGIGFYFWPCFSEIIYEKLFIKILQKNRFLRFLVFYCLKYFESISVKTKAFWEDFFNNLLRTKSSTNGENFIKICYPFCMHVWDPKELPIRKMGFFTLSYFKKL